MVKIIITLTLAAIFVSCEASPCPPDELIYKDGKCYPLGEGSDTPCRNDLTIYAERRDQPGQGGCNCLPSVGTANRPVARWQGKYQCWTVFDQGPCNNGEWLILDKSNKTSKQSAAVCAKRTCPENQNEDNFWFEHNGKCLQAATANPEFCGNDKDQVLFDHDKPEPICLEEEAAGRYYLTMLSLTCPKGQKQLMNGQCKKISHFGGGDYW